MTFRHWLKAFLLSPGIMFGYAYLVLWLGTNFYLDHTFKTDLLEAVSSATDHHCHPAIASLKASFSLNALTISELDLTASGKALNNQLPKKNIHIVKLEIPCPDIYLVLFQPRSSVIALTEKVSSAIISFDKTGYISMNHQPRSLQPDRSNLVNRVRQE
jgi:hypothetical protein